jgi:hypothetical protein
MLLSDAGGGPRFMHDRIANGYSDCGDWLGISIAGMPRAPPVMPKQSCPLICTTPTAQWNHSRKVYSWMFRTLPSARVGPAEDEPDGMTKRARLSLSESSREPLNKLSSQQTLLLGTPKEWGVGLSRG